MQRKVLIILPLHREIACGTTCEFFKSFVGKVRSRIFLLRHSISVSKIITVLCFVFVLLKIGTKYDAFK